MGDSVEIVLTEKLLRWIITARTTTTLPSKDAKLLDKYISIGKSHDRNISKVVPFEVVKIAHSAVKDDIYLHEMLEGTQIHYDLPPAEPNMNTELEARRKRLQVEQDNREYARMTKNVDPLTYEDNFSLKSFGQEVKEVNRHLLTLLNCVLTVAGAFLAGYKAVEYSSPDPHLNTQIMVGTIFATIVFFADVYFLIKGTV